MKLGRYYFSFLAFMLTISLTSCNLLVDFSFKETFEDYEAFQPDEGNNYSKVSDFRFNLQNINASQSMINLPSVGESRILVVPVKLNDGPSWSVTMLENVNLAFFGEALETGWQSVKSFYETSSYGKLTLTGEVAPVFNVDYTITDLALASKKSSGSSDEYRPDEIVLSLFQKDESYDTYRINNDMNKDGYIDSTVFVYSNAINNNLGYWAWVYWASGKPTGEVPIVNSYMWASYNFINGGQMQDISNNSYPYDSYGDKVDAHTIIHESGHLLGLDDYYCYDDENNWDPSGSIEMHSNNVGDENIFSKMALGWVEPYYVKSSNIGDKVELTLRSSSKYGDAIILNDGWNGTPCDEYIIIEYYSPSYLNYKDALSSYAGNGFRMYTTSGFRIYHIDARVAELSSSVRNPTFKRYVDDISSNGIYVIGASNSMSRSHLINNKGDFKLVHLLEAGGKNTFIQSASTKKKVTATNETLFKKGSSFKANDNFFYYGDRFNDFTKVGYQITIGECAEAYGSLTIEKI